MICMVIDFWDFFDIASLIYPDLEVMVQEFKYIRSLCDVEPWKSGMHREVDPGPECQTDDQIRGTLRSHTLIALRLMPYATDWIKNWHGTSWRM